jgi:hypothetical protein
MAAITETLGIRTQLSKSWRRCITRARSVKQSSQRNPRVTSETGIAFRLGTRLATVFGIGLAIASGDTQKARPQISCRRDGSPERSIEGERRNTYATTICTNI